MRETVTRGGKIVEILMVEWVFNNFFPCSLAFKLNT